MTVNKTKHTAKRLLHTIFLAFFALGPSPLFAQSTPARSFGGRPGATCGAILGQAVCINATGGITIPTYNNTGNQTLALTLSQQPSPILGSFFGQANSISESAMEFPDVFELFANTGSSISKTAPNNYLRSKVAFYSSVILGVNGGDGYAGNFVSYSPSGHSGNNIALELDNNSQAGNAATTLSALEAGGNVHAGEYISGQTGTGTGANQIVSGGLLINLAAGGFKPARGIGIYNGTVYGSLYEDDATATGNIMTSSGTKAGGIDLTGSTFSSGNAIKLTAGQMVAWYSSGGSLQASITGDTAGSFDISGALNATTYKVAGAVGVSCAAGSTSLLTLVVTSGIVTHC